ncbi:hypothetical protein [Hymenobacter pini]|uniref:hypothetical protein n=1 Tax=Hymenobacter pini TaxID=2880879 RepID=UPI001CF5D9D8|nr:hypothetical protein [Hymenobacter pini]MCA8831936.1 hypothetical protein [Hymenobacter pini]
MMTLQEIQQVEQQIEVLKIPINKASIIARLKKKLSAIEVVHDLLEEEELDNKEHATLIQAEEEKPMLPIDLVLFNIDGKTVVIPASVNEEANQVYASINLNTLKIELVKDYCSLYLQQQLGNIYEGARLVMLQIENIINCSLKEKDILNKIKTMPEQQLIWVWDFESKKLTKIRPAVYMYGDNEKKWHEKTTMPSDAYLNFVKKMTLFFAYCVNNDLKEGFKNGSIEPRLFKEINNIKKLRDKISHRFASSEAAIECNLLDLNESEAFMRIRSTLSNFLINKPNWL